MLLVYLFSAPSQTNVQWLRPQMVEIQEAKMTRHWINYYPETTKDWIVSGFNHGVSDKRISKLLRVSVKYVEWYRDLYRIATSPVREPQDASGPR